ncbi:type I secretion protein [Ruegeria sp. Alg231-54]|uniref:type I secretion protein n=1 Tax=Ruegeria sp. Alg231-54 TaxID=1922221 RepID=UPI000D55CCB9|nr:type I secretion protein [Ruegeria sp. Alg231-54]
MSLDSISETIAHFVGTFEITIEQTRLRDQYEEFTALRRKVELDELDDPISIQIAAELDLPPGEYDPLPYKLLPPPADLPLPPVPDGPLELSEIYVGPSFGPDPYIPDVQLGTEQTAVLILDPQVPPLIIGSAVTYTFQAIVLNDNDVIGHGDFRDIEIQIAQGEQMLDVALSLHAIATPSLNIEDYKSLEYLESLAEQMQSPMISQIEGVTIHQFHGEDALGVIVNGEVFEEIPDWDDLLPAHHQTEDEEEDDTPDMTPDEWDRSDDDEFGEGNTVIAGGNLAINEVNITVAWVDAPVIAVGGKSVSLTVVSQVAVVSDIDQGEPGVQSDTNVVQASFIGTEAGEEWWQDDNEAEPGEEPIVSVTWIQGDLWVTNFIKQVIDATDIDKINTEITASTSLFTLGDNVLSNVTNIVQLGNFYDLIMIGGNMVSVDMLHQTIALLDDDVYGGGKPAEGDDNLVMNQASLTTTGEDTVEELDMAHAEAMPLQQIDREAFEDALTSNPDYAGMELLRVLKIDGDLLQVNSVEQVTLLQDQDDISLEAAAAVDAAVNGAGNALLNAANITKTGVDSTIMAAGGEYSDLLLHQAALIDIPEVPDASELANEAIAIIMEETAGIGENAIAQAQSNLTPSENASTDDAMQTMLA